jgi:hypothetical protein
MEVLSSQISSLTAMCIVESVVESMAIQPALSALPQLAKEAEQGPGGAVHDSQDLTSVHINISKTLSSLFLSHYFKRKNR